MGNVRLPLSNDVPKRQHIVGSDCAARLGVLHVLRVTLCRYIPSELGYGDSGSPPKIKGGDPLVFQMEIIKIKVRACRRSARRRHCHLGRSQ
jgi:hypothetical protein